MKTSFRFAIVAALALIGLAASDAAGTASAVGSKPFPNIVFILADDLGYGDVGCYNPEAKAPTPNLDRLAKEGLPTHVYSRDCRAGLIAPDFNLEEADMIFLDKTERFLDQQVKENPGKPFFLFHSCQAVHQPSFPGRDFKGKTKAGPHGDFIFEFDAIVGRLLDKLQQLGVADNTLVIVSSDNGPEVDAIVNMRKDYGHDGARPWRGIKRDDWEGGHRVPMIARWPGRIKPGTRTAQTICLTDLMATCAALVGARLPDNAAEDSVNMLPVLLGKDGGKPIREFTLHQTISLALAIREGKWKYLDHKGSGGNRYDTPGLAPYALEENTPAAPGQLYDLEQDPGETDNLYFNHPEVVKRLKAKLDQAKKSGRSVPQPSTIPQTK